MMASAILMRSGSCSIKSAIGILRSAAFSSNYTRTDSPEFSSDHIRTDNSDWIGLDLISFAPGISLQKARSWNKGVSSKFSTTPLADIFKGKKVVIFGVFGAFTESFSVEHVPWYKYFRVNFKQQGIDSVVCVAINDPYVLNGWAEKLQARREIEFYADFDGSFHKKLDLCWDLSAIHLGIRNCGWSACVDDGVIRAFNFDGVPLRLKYSIPQVMLKQIQDLRYDGVLIIKGRPNKMGPNMFELDYVWRYDWNWWRVRKHGLLKKPKKKKKETKDPWWIKTA